MKIIYVLLLLIVVVFTSCSAGINQKDINKDLYKTCLTIHTEYYCDYWWKNKN